MAEKAVLIICDGLGDRPQPTLRGKTPLEAVKTRWLDALARKGVNGIMDVIAPGVPPGSDTAHLALFGYDPYAVYSGRGAFEAIGAGMKLQAGDVALRCNFATVDGGFTVLDRRAGRIGTGEAKQLAEALKGLRLDAFPDIEVFFEATTEHRGTLILRGKNLSPKVSDSDPEKEGMRIREAKPLDGSPEARRTAEALNAFTRLSHEVLERHPLNRERAARGLKPANALLLRGAGSLPNVTPITEVYHVKAGCIVANALVRGVAVAAGMEPIPVGGATGTVTSNLNAKAEAAAVKLAEYDFIFLHVKGADNASHDGNLKQKLLMVRKIDAMVGRLLRKIDLNRVCVALTADHSSSTALKSHVGDPVPVVIAGGDVIADGVKAFSERSCAAGGLGRIRGVDLMPLLMNLLGRMKKFGA